MRSIASLKHRLKRPLSSLPLLMLAVLLVTAGPTFGQSDGSAQPAPSSGASQAAPADPQAPTPAAEQPVDKSAEEKPAGEPESPAISTEPDQPDIEDLYGPDLPRKPVDKEPEPASQRPKSTEPVLYISDSDNGRIVVMQGIEGEGFTSLGLPGYGMGRFLRPAQVWLDYQARLYVADSGNNRVIRIDQQGTPGWTEVGSLSEPRGVAVDGSGVYVSDTKANRVVIYDELVNGAKVREVLTHPQLKRPAELWIDGEGALYICCGEDPPGGKLLKTWVEKGLAEKGVAKETRRWAVFEGEGLSGARFLPASIITEKSGLKLLDISGQRLVSMQDIAGKRLKEEKFRVDPRWRLSRPSGLAVAPSGDLFIADSGNDRILKLGKDGSVIGEFYIHDDDPSTLLANPSSIFIYSPAPPPAPKDDEDEDGKAKGKSKKATDDLEFDGGF